MFYGFIYRLGAFIDYFKKRLYDAIPCKNQQSHNNLNQLYLYDKGRNHHGNIP